MSLDVQGKVVLLTGASAGIGLAIAKKLSAQGATLALVARASDQLAELDRDLPGAAAFPTDLRQPAEIESLVKAVMARFGHIDILINCAGQSLFATVEEIDFEAYAAVMQLNVYAPLALMQQVIPIMRSQGGGTILNVSSRVSKAYIPNVAGYASTKYALNALSLTARQELEKDHITVSILCPGIVDTEFGKRGATPEPEALRYAPDGSVLPHVLSPERVADEVLKLLENGEAEVVMQIPTEREGGTN